jgi:hypothetical protein
VKIPENCLKQSIAIIGRTGSGKTYAAKGLVERILADDARVCIIDPLGVWWGLRSSVDGTKPAFPVVVFGGDHADIELTEGMGSALAETLANQNMPAIVDVSEFTSAGRTRFMTSFLEAIYVENRSPITFVVDEADMFAPQRPGKEQLTMLGRMEQICRRGRVRGFRPWLITQRPASLHKSVLSQANTLIALQLTAPQDRDALGDWIEGQADRVEGKKVLATLPKLARGEGFVWAPHENLLERTKFPAIATYDSSRTPEDGEQLPPVKLAEVDLSAIGEALKKLDEDAGAVDEDDPEQLRARIAELEGELDEMRNSASATDMALQMDNGAIEAARREGYARGVADSQPLVSDFEEVAATLAQASRMAEGVRNRIADCLARGVDQAPYAIRMPIDIQKAADIPPRSPHKIHTKGDKKGGNADLPRGEQQVLTAIAQHREGVTREQITVLTGYKRSTRDAYVQRLRERGLVDVGGDRIVATGEGLAALGPDFKPLPKGAALRKYWTDRLPQGERRVFEVVANLWPANVDRDKISAATDFKRSTRDAYLQRLATRQLITADRGTVRASDTLFR